jgi:hypothetical protein
LRDAVCNARTTRSCANNDGAAAQFNAAIVGDRRGCSANGAREAQRVQKANDTTDLSGIEDDRG